MARAGQVLRSLPYPVLEDGNLSYPQGEYTVDVTPQTDGASVIIHHQLQGASFLTQLLRQGQAKYGCLVAIPLTGYRKLHLSDDARQHVQWDLAVVGEPPLLRPLIVATTEIMHSFEPEDGVEEVWQGRAVKFPKGARLALRGYLRASSSLAELLEIHQDQEMSAGSFEVEPCTEDGFYFKVSVAPDVFLFLQHAGGYEQHRGSILTHIVSRCFEILQQSYSTQGEDGEEGAVWEQFSNLKALAQELNKYELPLWEEEGFAADKVATRLYPHHPPRHESGE